MSYYERLDELAGRKISPSANGLLLFNECSDDKQVGLWLESRLDCNDASLQLEQVKKEMLTNLCKGVVLILSWQMPVMVIIILSC